MAATFDAKSSSLNNVNAASITLAHTCGASATVLFVLVTGWQPGVTGITYNGVAMTLVGTSGASNAADNGWIYVLASPATGLHNIVVSGSGTSATEVWGISFTGTPTSGGSGTLWADFTSTKTAANGANSSISVPNNTSNDALIDAVAIGANATPTMGTQTNRTLAASGTSAPAGEGAGASYLAPAPASGSQTMNWTFASNSSAQVGVRVLGSAAADDYPAGRIPAFRHWVRR